MSFNSPFLTGCIGMSEIYQRFTDIFQAGQTAELRTVVGGDCLENIVPIVVQSLAETAEGTVTNRLVFKMCCMKRILKTYIATNGFKQFILCQAEILFYTTFT